MKATEKQVQLILNHPNTKSAMTRGKSLKSYVYSLSKEKASEIIDRLEMGEEVKVGK